MGPSWLETKLRRERDANLNNKEFLDGRETRTAMMTISEKIRIDERDVSNGRMGIRKLLASLTSYYGSDSRLEVLDDLNFKRTRRIL